MSLGISVIVCTYNRVELLEGALQSLCKQTLKPSEYEVIVVDNNSNDATAPLVADSCRRYGNLHYCFERQQGLSHARNRGWQEARGKYVGYIDDDCKAPADWLAVAREVIGQLSPAVLGGPYIPFYVTPRPAWFKDGYGCSYKGEEARPLTQNEYLSGGNVFFRRSLLDDLDGFDACFGMCGDSLGYGEETVMQRHIRATRPDELIYYDPRLYVYHLVSPDKMSLRCIARQRFVDGRYSYLVFLRDAPDTASQRRIIRSIVHTLYGLGRDLVVGAPRRDRIRYPYIQNYLYEHVFVQLRQLGQLYERLRGLPKQSTEAPNAS